MQAYRKEKDGDVIKRLQLMLYVKIDGMTPSKAANTMHMSRSWGGKWNKRYGFCYNPCWCHIRPPF